MSDSPVPQPPFPLNEQVESLRQQLATLANRMDRAEERLGWGRPAPATAYPPPTSPPARQTSPPPAAPPSAPPSVLPPHLQVQAPPAPLPMPVPSPVTSSPAVAPPEPARTTASSPLPLPAVPRPAPLPRPATPPPPPSAPSVPTPPAGEGLPWMSGDWERLIGGKWALWVGTLSIFLALASFLAYTWQSLPPIPPAGRVGGGLLAGLACLVGGGLTRNRGQRWFSEGISGAGLAILYLSIWAGTQYFHLVPQPLAFTAMATTTAIGVALAVSYNAISLSLIATLGGYLTPLLLHDGSGHVATAGKALPFLAYLAVLGAGIVAVSLFKRWRSLVWISFNATILLLGLWSMDSYTTALRWPVFTFLTLYFLMFFGASCFYSLRHREQTAQPELLLLFSTVSTYALAGYAVLDGALGNFPAVFPLGLALFFAAMATLTRGLAPENKALRQTLGGLSLFGLTVAVPIQLHQSALAIGWSVEAAVLLVLALRLQAPLLRRAGQIVWALSLLPLLDSLLQADVTSHILFFNERALPLLVSVLGSALVVRLTGDAQIANQDASALAGETDPFVPLYAAYSALAGAWLVGQEAYLACSWHWRAASALAENAPYIVAVALGVYALGVFALGISARNATLRICSVLLVALAGAIPIWNSVSQPTYEWAPFWNLRWLAYLILATVIAAMGWLSRRPGSRLDASEVEALGIWPGVLSLFTLTGMTFETYAGFAHGHVQADGDWKTLAALAVAILWSVSAAGMLALGRAFRDSLLGAVSLLVGAAGVVLLLSVSLSSGDIQWTPLFNLRFLAFAITVLAALWASVEVKTGAPNSAAASTLGFSALSLAVWALTQETYGACSYYRAELGGHWSVVGHLAIATLWTAGACAGLALGLRRDEVGWRLGSAILGVAGVGLLLFGAIESARFGWTPFLNARFIGCAVAALAASGSAAMLRRNRAVLLPEEIGAIGALGIFALLLLLGALTQETYESCFFLRATLGPHWDRWAQMVASVVWSVYGAGLLIGGISRRYQPLRLSALALLSVTVVKVFLLDLGFLDGLARMLSLAGLGLSLIFISFLYSRFGIEAQDGEGDR